MRPGSLTLFSLITVLSFLPLAPQLHHPFIPFATHPADVGSFRKAGRKIFAIRFPESGVLLLLLIHRKKCGLGFLFSTRECTCSKVFNTFLGGTRAHCFASLSQAPLKRPGLLTELLKNGEGMDQRYRIRRTSASKLSRENWPGARGLSELATENERMQD